MYLYGINHYKVTLSNDQVSRLQQKFLFHKEIWYEYDFCWITMYDHHVKSRIKEFMRLLDLYVNTYEPDNFDLIKKILYRNVNLDEKHLICFRNGIYDLKLHQFRSSSPYDYCTMCTKYNYEKSGNKSFLSNIFKLHTDYIKFINSLYLVLIGYKILVYKTPLNIIFLIYHLFGSYVRNCSIKHFTSPVNERYIMDIDLNKNDIIYIDKLISNHAVFVSQKIDRQCDYPLTCNLNCELKVNSSYNRLDNNYIELMYQLIQMEEIPIKIINFKNNPIFINDITHYILSYYNDIYI